MKTALTIGGSDPTGGAGIQADLKTFKSFGVYGLCIPSALTAQNTTGVFEIHDLPPGFFLQQLETLLSDIRPDSSKTGMLSNIVVVEIVVRTINKYSLKNLVIDPVTISSTGVPLIKGKALDFIISHLFPLAKTITPNIHEASLITGMNIADEVDMKKAAVKLIGLGPETVIITGGHLHGKTADLFFDGSEFISLHRDKFEGEYHGTGCVFSSAITAGLALGLDIKEAAVKANEFVWNAIRSAISIGKGMKVPDI
ncbi:MAG: bifunctional hydroxymethylpyrimidine kinase/phosphomethylpyrimidine kinase [Nitrospirae bacterium]|nr:bifunctional hydroxymethylpyrimidine kinase/phosphomethylpyrimidine kinase [Nitrospirota bacterium]